MILSLLVTNLSSLFPVLVCFSACLAYQPSNSSPPVFASVSSVLVSGVKVVGSGEKGCPFSVLYIIFLRHLYMQEVGLYVEWCVCLCDVLGSGYSDYTFSHKESPN